jgi:hypothetical protein
MLFKQLSPKMHLVLWKYFFLLHLLLVILYNIVMTIDSYSKFSKDKSFNSISNNISKFTNLKMIKLYSRYTGSSTGFGFYAPNVLSSGFLSFTDEDKTYAFSFKNHENTIRYLSLNTVILQNALEAMDRDTSKKTEINEILDKKYLEIDSVYTDIMLKNLTSHFYTDTNISKAINLKFLIYHYPSLEEMNKFKIEPMGEFITLFEKKYTFKKL